MIKMPNKINHIHPHQLLQSKPIQQKDQPKSTIFKDMLTEQTNELKISKHAKERLAERDIQINDTQWKNISHQVSKAKEKGVRDSLVVLNDATLLVSAKNNTVITALGRDEASSRIFTNINGTIIMNE